MIRKLIKIEWIKATGSRASLLMLSVFAFMVTAPLFSFYFYVRGRMDEDVAMKEALKFDKMFTFPEVTYIISYVSSWMILLPVLIFIMHVCKEFTYKTFRQHLIDGLNRSELLYGKLLYALLLSLLMTFFVLIISMIVSTIQGGLAYPADVGNAFKYLAGFWGYSIGALIIALVFALLIRKTIISFLLFIAYYYAELLMINRLDIGEALLQPPLRQFSLLIGHPVYFNVGDNNPGIISTDDDILSTQNPFDSEWYLCIVFLGLFILLATYLLRRRSL